MREGLDVRLYAARDGVAGWLPVEESDVAHAVNQDVGQFEVVVRLFGFMEFFESR